MSDSEAAPTKTRFCTVLLLIKCPFAVLLLLMVLDERETPKMISRVGLTSQYGVFGRPTSRLDSVGVPVVQVVVQVVQIFLRRDGYFAIFLFQDVYLLLV